ncbi:hypothetical protein N7456_008640 [Penicillium angulare]|uniref:Uncharacterized protein n=1 Tax=Penicillium angulare TaxID=116970 RepID=A0A9W9F3D2_9EURO|nr:hypothetical protein N7456_008640 [Penicillium angulare]
MDLGQKLYLEPFNEHEAILQHPQTNTLATRQSCPHDCHSLADDALLEFAWPFQGTSSFATSPFDYFNTVHGDSSANKLSSLEPSNHFNIFQPAQSTSSFFRSEGFDNVVYQGSEMDLSPAGPQHDTK